MKIRVADSEAQLALIRASEICNVTELFLAAFADNPHGPLVGLKQLRKTATDEIVAFVIVIDEARWKKLWWQGKIDSICNAFRFLQESEVQHYAYDL